MKRLLLTCVVLGAATAAWADPRSAGEAELTADKRADIEALLTVTGAVNVGRQMSELMVTQMTESLKELRPDVEPRMYDVLRDEVNMVISENIPALVELIVPVYHRHFSHAEIRELIAFYQTDLGRKTIAVMPLVLQEGVLAGQQWGRVLAPVIEQRVRRRFGKEGVDFSA